MTVWGLLVPIVLAVGAAPAPTPVNINMTRPPIPQVNLPRQAAPQAPLVQTPLAQHAPWLTHAFAGIFVFLAVALVLLLAFQTTKQEGLSGTIGGRVESAYRPRLGFDQQLARTTSWVAIAFVFFGFLVSLSGI